MPIDFFERELERVQRNFKRAYGGVVVVSIKQREAVIMSIIHMGLLTRTIKKAGLVEGRPAIRRFIKIRNKLNRHFTLIRKHNERRQHADRNRDGHQGSANDGRRARGQDRQHLREVR